MKTKFKPQMVRQGDVLLVPLAKAPKADALDEVTDPRGVVLAEGETSGHHHTLFGSGAKLFRYRDSTSADRVLVAPEGGTLRVVGGGSGGVDRHTPIDLAKGTYAVRIQRRWDSATARASRVED